MFDTRSNQPVAGAVLTLVDRETGQPAAVFGADGASAAPSRLTTGSDGRFRFPVVRPGLYAVEVVPPAGYSAVGSLAANRLPAGRTIDPNGSFGGTFRVDPRAPAAAFDVPLESVLGVGGLVVGKQASTGLAEIGETVAYEVEVRNATGSTLPAVELVDRLPPGFTFQPGSLRVNGTATADPPVSGGAQMRVVLGDFGAGQAMRVAYRTRIGPGALHGDGVNRAQAISRGARLLRSNEATAQVKLQEGVFTDRGVVIGKVFVDINRNRVQDAEEPGIPGVRLYLEDGSFAITDSEGKYSFYGLTPRTHVLKLDRTTMPRGSELLELSTRNAGDAGSRFVDLKFGELHKANFAEGSATPEILRQVQARRARGEVTEAQVEKPTGTLLGKSWPAESTSPVGTAMTSAGESAGVGEGAGPAAMGAGSAPGGTLLGQEAREAVPSALVGSGVGGGSGSATWVPASTSSGHFDPVLPAETLRSAAGSGPGRPIVLVPRKEAIADGVTPVKIRIRLEDADGARVVARSPLTLETSLGRWQVADTNRNEPGVQTYLEGGEGEFALVPPAEPGDAELRVSSGRHQTRAVVPFLPDLRPLIASGVLEGVLNLNRLGRGAFLSTTSRDGFEEELRSFAITGNNGKQSAAGRAAFFLKGKIKGEYLLTMAYDSERDTRERLFRDIQPDQFYPVYGDASVRGYDAQSSGRLYLRVDRRKCYLLLGDFNTASTTEVRGLGNYERSLNGVQTHFETRRLNANVWAAYDSTRQVVEELPANGTSGPYNFRTANGLVNSEKVEILTRDRHQPALIVKAVPMLRFADYEFEPFTGRLLFKRPVPSLDENLNPISIRITYEVEQGTEKFWVYGADAQVKVTDRLEVGGAAVRDENPQAPYSLYSVNSTVKLGSNTYLLGELAQSEADLTGVGRAGRAELRHQDERVDVRLYYGITEENFTNNTAILMPGRIESGLRVAYQLTPRDRLIGQGLWSEDDLYDGTLKGARLDWEHTFANDLRVELGVRHSQLSTAPVGPSTHGLGANEVTSLRLKVTTPVPGIKRLQVYGEYENDVVEPDNRLVAAGGVYQLSPRTRAYARHEFLNALGGPFELNRLQQNNRTVVGLETEYLKDAHLFNEYRARDAFTGREAEAATGLRNAWQVADGVRAHTTFERVSPFVGSGLNEATAVAGALEYTRDPLWKGTARLELRTSTPSDSLLNTLGYARKLDRDWTLLARTIVYLVDNHDPDSHNRTQARFQIGMAYRQTELDRWNGLIKYELKYEDNGLGMILSETIRRVHIASLDLNFQPTRDWTLSTHYAGKLVTESDPFADTTYHAHLLAARLIYELTRRWDIGLVGSTFFDRDFTRVHYGFGPEVGYTLKRNVRIGLGYNFFGFHDRDFNEDYTNPGLYLNLRLKFDETLLGLRKPEDDDT